ncbi:HET-domain-containing protein [Thozetella sp. PMI_491]|nr:HET-domain-containing protein [Thozetella sp. PMI_491]
MRLLHSTTKELKDFVEGSTPPFAILSHTWGADEVSLQELKALTTFQDDASSHPLRSTEGYRKIDGCCALARSNGLEWVWIDTCCIDKTSSSELSEAINSIFRWYKESSVCYVYLSDVALPEQVQLPESSFRRSRWFTRGWTLQELVAPKVVNFYGSSWEFIETRSSLRDLLHEITGIPAAVFISKSLHDVSIAQRMSWAAKRQTTKVEDWAYSLLGLCDVTMPLLYGEGEKAFQRLQEEIIKQSNDQSIFAWGFGSWVCQLAWSY